MSSDREARSAGASWSPSPSRRAKDALKRLAGLPWEAGFAALGALAPGRVTPGPWAPIGGPALVVAPHPDDEVHGCGGTILLHRAAGEDVTVVHVTDGRRSRALGLGPEAMAGRRRAEAEAAAEVLDVTGFEWLGFPEGDWDRSEVVTALAERIALARPRVIYAPSRIDFHPEHVRVAQAVAASLPVGGTARVRVYPVQVPLTTLLTNVVARTGSVADVSRAALERYGSQLGALRGSLRMKRYAALRYHAGSQAEPFCEMSLQAYRALHGATTDTAPEASTPFRGIRQLPFTDPLAYLTGRGARRRLRGTIDLE